MQWMCSHGVQIAVPFILEDFIGWLKDEKEVRPVWKGWTYPLLFFTIFTIRMISARRGMFNIMMTCALVSSSLRV